MAEVQRESHRKRLPIAAIVVALIVAVIIVGVVIFVKKSRDATLAADAVDAAMAAEAEQLVIADLSTRGPDDPLIRRLGTFKGLIGTGYDRPHYAWQLIERVEFSRRAQFSNGKVPLGVVICVAGPLSMELQIYPDTEWLAEHPEVQQVNPDAEWLAAHPEAASVAARGGIINFSTAGSGISATQIDVDVTHPNFKAR